jgi:hypothetical protein
MKLIVLFVLCFLLLCPADALGQSAESQYTEDCFYFELLGQGLLYSINYDHRFGEAVSGRVGYTRWREPFTYHGYSVTACPIMMNYLTERGSHHLELGLGVIAVQVRSSGEDFFGEMVVKGGRSFIFGTGTLGYRYQPLRRGTLFRVGLAPIVGAKDGPVVLPYLSIGLAF